MKKILIVSGHPDLNDSFANKTILEETKKLLPEAEFVYLDKFYPDFRIDTKAEQERLLRADIIVLQYPLFWYSAPSLLAPLDETDLHAWILSRQDGGQAAWQTTRAVLHFRRTRRNVLLRRTATLSHR